MRIAVLSALLATSFAAPAFAEAPVVRAVQDRSADRMPLGTESIYGERQLPTLRNGEMQLPPLHAATTDLGEVGTGTLPDDFHATAAVPAVPLREGIDREDGVAPLAFAWKPPAVVTSPKYFEEIMLERHGHQRVPLLQPVLSGARFFGTIPALPYLMTLEPPGSVQYELGYWRPGSRAPLLLQRPPFQMEAVTVQTIAVSSGILAIP